MPDPKKTAKILLVEDNPLNRELVCDLLEAYGYQVSYAEEARGCWEKLKTDKPDLILMDLQLPGTDGYFLTREIKKNPEIFSGPIVALTAFAMPGDKEKAMQAGCQGIITKPIDTHLFPDQIKHFLENPEFEDHQ